MILGQTSSARLGCRLAQAYSRFSHTGDRFPSGWRPPGADRSGIGVGRSGPPLVPRLLALGKNHRWRRHLTHSLF